MDGVLAPPSGTFMVQLSVYFSLNVWPVFFFFFFVCYAGLGVLAPNAHVFQYLML